MSELKLTTIDFELEKTVLGCLIYDSSAFSNVSDILNEQSFEFAPNKAIFKAIKYLNDNDILIDLLSVIARLKKTGDILIADNVYVSNLLGGVCSSDNYVFASLALKELYFKRLTLNHAELLAKKSTDRLCDVEDLMKVIDNFSVQFNSEISTISGNMIKESIVSLNQKIEFEPHFLSIKQNDKLYGVMSKNNLSAIIGKAKSRKTFFATKLIASICKGGYTDDLIFAKRSKIAYFDTEQSRLHIQKVIKRVAFLTNTDNHPDNIQVYALKQYSVTQRKKIVETVIKMDKPDVCFIDGIRDLILDFNDLKEASNLINWLMMLIDKYNCHICNIIHVNKADSNPRGHLGTEIVNKCESVIKVEKNTENNNVSTVISEYSRDEQFEPIELYITEGYPYLENSTKEKKQNNNKIPF